MNINTKKIFDGDVVTTPEIPTNTKRCVMIKYKGMGVLIPLEHLYNGKYRLDFVRSHGIPLPPVDVTREIREVFSPNIGLVIE